ncbi:DUF1579 domain-containing protein [Tundrisphaera lichenicola]|uniref:DUF1579 domain-containing protein n=1 Tax=Tundrisphaera lichenicola TaxID=2029860 RepID=UPI003EBB991D
MNLQKPLAFLCLTASILGCPPMTTAQEPPPPPKPMAEHKILAEDEGTWDATIKSFVAGPDAEPMVSKGTEVNTVMPGGLWVLSKFEGSFGDAKFEGRGQFGYDSAKKKYVGTWIDSMSPSLSILEGTYDAKTRTMTFEGDGYDPSTKTKYTQKMVTTTKEDGKRVFTLYMKFDGGGDEVKFMEVEYTRRKS